MSEGITTRTFRASFSPEGVRNAAEVVDLFRDTVEWLDYASDEEGFDLSWDTMDLETRYEEVENITFSDMSNVADSWTSIVIRVTGFKRVEVDD